MNSIIETSKVNTIDSENVNLMESILIIWKQKVLILVCTIISALVGLIYVNYIMKDTFDVSINIYPLTQNQTKEFLELDQAIVENFGETKDLSITPEFLMQRFINVLLEREVFINNFRQTNYIKRSDYPTDQSYEKVLRKTAFNIAIERAYTKKDIEQKNLIDNWVMRFSHTGEIEDIVNMLEDVTKVSMRKVVENINTFIRIKIDSKKIRQNFKIKDLELSIENLRFDYSTITKNRLIYMKEQAQVARELGIKEGIVDTRKLEIQKGLVENTAYFSEENSNTLITRITEVPDYKNGYIALEKEIEIIEARKNLDPFIPELIYLQQDLRSLKENPELSRLENIYKNSSLFKNPDFQPVYLEVASANIVNQNSSIQIFIIFIFAGITLCIIYLIFRHNYMLYKHKKEL